MFINIYSLIRAFHFNSKQSVIYSYIPKEMIPVPVEFTSPLLSSLGAEMHIHHSYTVTYSNYTKNSINKQFSSLHLK